MLQCTMSSHIEDGNGHGPQVNPNPQFMTLDPVRVMGFGAAICLKKSEDIPSG